MAEAGLKALRASDPVFARLIDAAGKPRPLDGPDRAAPGEHYAALVRAIVGQQLSTKAARSIWLRVVEHFGGHAPTPAQVLACDPEELRAAGGLSRAKTSYLRSLAEHVESGELELGRLEELTDDEVIAELTAVRGIGEWSAHMFLIFQLRRPDVIAPGDLGIRRAIQIAYGMDELPTAAEVIERAEPWRPHRSLACRYLWRSLDNEPA